MASVAPSLPWELSEIDEVAEAQLVTEDDEPLDSILTEKQERLLSEPLYASWSGPPPGEGPPQGAPGESPPPRPFAVMANVGLFSTIQEPPVVPDVMLSLDVTIPQDLRQKKNRSYFLWRYRKPPEVVIEIVSNRKGGELGERRRRYLRMQVAYYVVYDPLHEIGAQTLRAFQLRDGRYVEMRRPWFEDIGLGLSMWEGTYEGMEASWLRWHTRDGLVPTGVERAEAASQDAERAKARAAAAVEDVERAKARAAAATQDAERERGRAAAATQDAERARARAEHLAARLRALGVDPDVNLDSNSDSNPDDKH